MKTMAIWLDRFSARLNRLALWGAVAIVGSLVVVAMWQVIARYFLAQPPVWTEELARYLMVWGALLGGSCAFRAHADPSLFPGQRERGGLVSVLRAIGAFTFIAPILWFSVLGLNGKVGSGYIGRLMGREAETLDVSMALFGMAIPIAFALILVHLLADLVMHLSGQKTADN